MRLKPFHMNLAAAIALAGLFGGNAAVAAPVTSFLGIPVADANATTDDPNLLGKVQNLMSVNVGANDWTNASIRITLTAGTVYNATNAVGTDAAPNSAF